MTACSSRGKSHLVIAIAYRAIQNGFTARFVTAAVLIESLSVASRQGRLQEQLAHYLQPHVLVIDEVGYLSYGPDAANVLFHIVNERHQRRRPMLFTTNKPPLTAWGEVLHDHDLAEAIVDRVLENVRLLLLDGPSYRTRHLDLPARDAHDAINQPARISGNQPAEFPEPTNASLIGLHSPAKYRPRSSTPSRDRRERRTLHSERSGAQAPTVRRVYRSTPGTRDSGGGFDPQRSRSPNAAGWNRGHRAESTRLTAPASQVVTGLPLYVSSTAQGCLARASQRKGTRHRAGKFGRRTRCAVLTSDPQRANLDGSGEQYVVTVPPSVTLVGRHRPLP